MTRLTNLRGVNGWTNVTLEPLPGSGWVPVGDTRMIGTPSKSSRAARDMREPLVLMEAASSIKTSGEFLAAALIPLSTLWWTVTSNPFFSSAEANEGALGRPLSIRRIFAIAIQ